MKKLLFFSVLIISSASMQAMDTDPFDSAELFDQLNQRNDNNVKGNQDCLGKLKAMVENIPDATVCKFGYEEEKLCVERDGKLLGKGCDRPTDCKTHEGRNVFDTVIRFDIPKACPDASDVECVKKALIKEANMLSAKSKEPWCNSDQNAWGPTYNKAGIALLKAYTCIANKDPRIERKNLKDFYENFGK